MVKFRPKIVTNYMFISGAKSPKPKTQSASCIGQFYLLELDLKSPPKQKLRLFKLQSPRTQEEEGM